MSMTQPLECYRRESSHQGGWQQFLYPRAEKLPFVPPLYPMPTSLLFSLKHKNINILGSTSQKPVMPSIKLQTFHCQCCGHRASRSVPLAAETPPSLSLTPLRSFALLPRLLFSSAYTLSLGKPTIFICLYDGAIKKNHIYFHFSS